MADDVLTTTEAARLLGISVRTAQLLIEGGGLPSWKTPGGHRRVRRADVTALMPSSRLPAETRAPVVLVVTDESRQQGFAERLGTNGYFAVQFQADPWSAALAVGQRPPGVVIVDLRVNRDSGVALLGKLAEDARFREVGLIGVDADAAGAPLPSPRARHVPLDAVGDAVASLLQDARRPAALLAADFPMAPNEAARLIAVERSGLVDTPTEAPFDRLTSLAVDHLQSPVALMTILTADRQWFKSRQGLDLPETPRSWAFCNHTVLQRDVHEVGDLAGDDTFRTNPAVAGAPHFRHYAGAPVYDPDGFALGSICVMDFRPRELNRTQRRTLLDLAAIATDAVKLRGLSATH